MKTIIGCVGIIWISSICCFGAETASLSSDQLYTGLARNLLERALDSGPAWTCKVGLEIDDIAHPPYVPETDDQAVRTNRRLARVVEQLRPAGALSMVHDRLTCQLKDQSLDLDIQITVFKTLQDCQKYWGRRLPKQVREKMIIVDNVGDACFKQSGPALTYFYLRRHNVTVEARGRHDHEVLLQWLQHLDQSILTPASKSVTADPTQSPEGDAIRHDRDH